MVKATCTIPGCPKPVRVKSRGLCNQHYHAWRRHGDPLVKKERWPAEPSTGFRTCSKCQRTLPLDDDHFFRHATGQGGYRRDCKDCRTAYDKARYQAKGEQIRAYQAIYRADPEHRRKDRESSAQWRAENPERHRAALARNRARPGKQEVANQRSRAWRIANPERKNENERRRSALKRNGTATRIPVELLAAKLAYWGGRCWIAGPGCTVEPEQWDHVKPLSKGGPHLLANLRPACANCNDRKKARWPFAVVLAWRVSA
jgi:5-methylcytosine-specific restriction endonuclease McrA